MHQVKRKVIIPKMFYEELEQEILMQKWRERIFSNRQLGMRIYIRILVIMVLE